MPVPMSVMQAAAQGDKKAMRLVEQEYGVGDGRRYAENWLTEEEPPPTFPLHPHDSPFSPRLDDVKGLNKPHRPNVDWLYEKEAKEQVREGEIDILVDKIKHPEQYSFREPKDMLFSEKQIDPETHSFDRYAAYGKMQPGYVGLQTPGQPNKREAYEIEFKETWIPPPHIEKQILELGLRGTRGNYYQAAFALGRLNKEGLLTDMQQIEIQEKLDKQYGEQVRNKQRSENIQSKRR
jgi:hypothetical protein